MASVYFVSLGCDKNLCDSEHMIFDLQKSGHNICDDPAEAEVIVINTCSFILDAMQESIDTIIEMGSYKENGSCRALIITGCLGQRFFDEIEAELPEVDAVLGTNSWDKLSATIDELLAAKDMTTPMIRIDELTGLPRSEGRVRTDPIPCAYLKIAEGCNKRCTYCVIPKLRGAYRSVPMEELLEEAKRLVSEGVTEISLVAQEVTLYGVDLYGEKSLTRLLKELTKIEGLGWIRLLYCYPEEIDDDLIEVMAQNEKICHYIDMPIQHSSDAILKRMGRRTDKADIVRIIEKLRNAMPDIAIRTTLIAGFPGETEEDHKELLDFIKTIRFDRLGCFAYSREEGTVAYDMEDQVPDEIKDRWVDEIMRAQKEVTLDINKSLLNTTIRCFIEGSIEEGVYVARSYRDAGDVDCCVFVETKDPLMSGEFCDVTIRDFKDYDLIGEIAH